VNQVRLPSGDPRLDQILGGGLPANGLAIVMGVPGAGKTILSQQYLFRNASEDRPGIFLSTVSEPLEKVLRYAQGLSFFDPEAIGTKVFYESLGETLGDGGLEAVLDRIDGILKQRRPGLLVIDSFKALHAYAVDAEEFRKFLHRLASPLAVFPVTTILVGEYTEAEIPDAPEFAVGDSIPRPASEGEGERTRRVLEVVKLRGSGFLSGRHAYRISGSGLRSFPRLADPVDRAAYPLLEDRPSSGVPALDRMLAGGLFRDASTLVLGPAGSGKTLLGLHFLFEGAERGEPGVLATFQEHPTQLERICGGFGWSLAEQRVRVLHRPPVDLSIDEWVYELLETLEGRAARRVVIDGLGDLRLASRDEVRFREYTYSLLHRMSRSGITVLMTQETPGFFGALKVADLGVSHLADNVILLEYRRADSEVGRSITVLKHRASTHDTTIRQFAITSAGIEIGEPLG
jgi:circadian clock protein KaiC